MRKARWGRKVETEHSHEIHYYLSRKISEEKRDAREKMTYNFYASENCKNLIVHPMFREGWDEDMPEESQQRQ